MIKELQLQPRKAALYTYSNSEVPLLALRLPPEIEKRLEALARRTGRSKSFYARAAILEHLDDVEDLYLAERELEAVRSGTAEMVPLDEMMKRYDLAD